MLEDAQEELCWHAVERWCFVAEGPHPVGIPSLAVIVVVASECASCAHQHRRLEVAPDLIAQLALGLPYRFFPCLYARSSQWQAISPLLRTTQVESEEEGQRSRRGCAHSHPCRHHSYKLVGSGTVNGKGPAPIKPPSPAHDGARTGALPSPGLPTSRQSVCQLPTVYERHPVGKSTTTKPPSPPQPGAAHKKPEGTTDKRAFHLTPASRYRRMF